MNVINVTIDFEKGINRIEGIPIILSDYNSTKMVFNFNEAEGDKFLRIVDLSNYTLLNKKIENNEVILAPNHPLFPTEGDYEYNVTLETEDSVLTSVPNYITVYKDIVKEEEE